MNDDFYAFHHKCDAMPDNVRFLKINGSTSSQFTIESNKKSAYLHSTTLYGFRYCPYCGEDMEAER